MIIYKLMLFFLLIALLLFPVQANIAIESTASRHYSDGTVISNISDIRFVSLFNNNLTDQTQHSSVFGHNISYTTGVHSQSALFNSTSYILFNDTAGIGNLSFFPYGIKNVSEVPYVHQGLSYDGTYFYLIDTNAIKKTDVNFNIISQNLSINIPFTNHSGDSAYYNGLLYIPQETYASCSDYSGANVSVFYSANLTLKESFFVFGEISGVAIDSSNDTIYTSSYCSNNVSKYGLTNHTWLSNFTITGETLSGVQGIEFKGGYIYISANSGSFTNGLGITDTYSRIYKIGMSGTVIDTVYTPPSDLIEGIDYYDDLRLLNDELTYLHNSAVVYHLYPITGTTISFWWNNSKIYNTSVFERVIDTYDDSFGIFTRPSGSNQFEVKIQTKEGAATRPTVLSTVATSSFGVSENNFSHYIVSYNFTNKTIDVWINGKKAASATRDGLSIRSNFTWFMGGFPNPNALLPMYSASVDNVFMHSRAISDIEASYIYNNTNGYNFVVTPSSDSVDVDIIAWNTTGDYKKIWNESSTNASITSSHVVGDFPANEWIAVTKNGVKYADLRTNSSGYIIFVYSDGYSEIQFEATFTDNQNDYVASTCSSTISWWTIGIAMSVIVIIAFGGMLAIGFITGAMPFDTDKLVDFAGNIILFMVFGMIGVGIAIQILNIVGCS